MRKRSWQTTLGLILIGLSGVFYLLHFLIFRDLHHIAIYLLGDMAFLPIDVLIVTLILHRILEMHEKRSMLEKLNMVIGTFFSEAGTELLSLCPSFDVNAGDMKKSLLVKADWSEKDFLRARAAVKKCEHAVDITKGSLAELKEFLITKRAFLLSLLENPNLLEHDSFTNLLWAVFHLSEELSYRKDISSLPQKDHDHLSGDIRRVYVLLITEWLDYMRHLKKSYPYLFSLALRTNPFDPEASVIIR